MPGFISKNLVLLLLGSAIVYSSCKKDHTPPPPPVEEPSPYYLNCTINGVESKCDTNLSANLTMSSRPGFWYTSIGLYGYDKDIRTNLFFDIDNYRSGWTYGYPLPIKEGIYSSKRSDYGVRAVFYITPDNFITSPWAADTSNFYITITNLDSASIKGTFNGRVYKEKSGDADTTNYKDITNGIFYLKLTRSRLM